MFFACVIELDWCVADVSSVSHSSEQTFKKNSNVLQSNERSSRLRSYKKIFKDLHVKSSGFARGDD